MSLPPSGRKVLPTIPTDVILHGNVWFIGEIIIAVVKIISCILVLSSVEFIVVIAFKACFIEEIIQAVVTKTSWILVLYDVIQYVAIAAVPIKTWLVESHNASNDVKAGPRLIKIGIF